MRKRKERRVEEETEEREIRAASGCEAPFGLVKDTSITPKDNRGSSQSIFLLAIGFMF